MAISTATTTATNNNGVVNQYQWYFATDAVAAVATTFTLPFAPRYIKFVNLTDRIQDEWVYGMSAANSLHTVAVGTVTLETTNGITVSGNTFSVTATTMVASKSFYVVAMP
jgi:hypothetical protein